MALIADQNIKMWRGNTKLLKFTVTDISSVSGTTIEWQAAALSAPGTALIVKSTPEITTADNVFTVELEPGDTVDLDCRKLIHGAKIITEDEREFVVAQGRIELFDHVFIGSGGD